MAVRSANTSSLNETEIPSFGDVSWALASTKQGTGILRHFYTKKGSKGQVQVVGKAVNRGGGYGMEIPCVYKFTGQPRNVDMLKKILEHSK